MSKNHPPPPPGFSLIPPPPAGFTIAGDTAPSPTLLASRQEASKQEFDANKPQSTIGSRGREAALGILEPFDLHNVPGLVESVGSALWDAMSGNAMKTMQTAKALVTAPLEPVREFGAGIAEGDYDKAAHGAGGLLSQTAPALDMAAAGARKVLPTVPTAETARTMYRQALRPSLNMKPEAVARAVETGLERELLISDEGVRKLDTLVDQHNAAVEAKIGPGNVNKFNVASRLKDTAAKFENQPRPRADLETISKAGNEFLEDQPALIPNKTAQAMKKGGNERLKGKYGELQEAEFEADKSLVRGLKEELENQFPEIKGENAGTADLLNLRPSLVRTVERLKNGTAGGRLGPVVLGGVVSALSGSASVGTAVWLLKSVLEDPMIASKLAIAINRAQKANPSKYGPPSMKTAAARVAAVSSGFKASADSNAAESQTDAGR